MNKIFKKWNLNKNIKLSLLSLASGFILLTFYLKYKKEQRIIREKLIKYNPLLNPSRKILKINREKMIDILYDLKFRFMRIIDSFSEIKNQEIDPELMDIKTQCTDKYEVVNIIKDNEAYILMTYDTNIEEFKNALNNDYKDDEIIQKLFSNSYEILVKSLNEEKEQEKEIIEYKCSFSEEDIYDYYFAFFKENSKLFRKEVERIKFISNSIRINHSNPNIIKFITNSQNYKAKEIFLRNFFEINAKNNQIILDILEKDFMLHKNKNLIFKNNMKNLMNSHQNMEEAITLSSDSTISDEKINTFYDSIVIY